MGGRGDEPVRGTSALTVEGDLPGSLAISLHGVLRSGILWTVSRSCSVGRPIRPSGYRPHSSVHVRMNAEVFG